MIFTVTKLPKNNAWAAANAIGPFIFVKPEHRNNAGLIAHEQSHVKWFWIVTAVSLAVLAALLYFGLVSFPLYFLILAVTVKPLSYFLKPVRLHEEAAAYAIQHDTNSEGNHKLDQYAVALATHYGLDITVAQARDIIRKYEQA